MDNQQVSSSSSRSTNPVHGSNFTSIVLKKLDNLVASNTEKKTEKRWKANPHRGIATSDKVFAVICKKKEKKKRNKKQTLS